ncbi:hypothetical protein MPH_13120 [Macrophomina phaseolina MS6]|uniref:Uncharacterized protein n=1 Tax=Macrophomina phaseolina (strain MS6) TaxID=1126212 RepID=K2RZA8_MACPH|nr:hypothetical protein MPH_13120 [Macrophomina phaseolina MS6]
MRIANTASLAIVLLLGAAAAAPVAVDADGAHLDYIYTQNKGEKRDEPLRPDYIYTQKKGEKRDEPLRPDYIYTQKKGEKRGDSHRLVDLITIEGGPGN